MAAWKRAPAESKENANDIRPSTKEPRKCVAIKIDPTMWECAKRTPQRALETETDPERRRNIEACLGNEVFIALDGVVEHMTEKDSFAKDWLELTASGRMRKDVAFVMLGPDYGPDVKPPDLYRKFWKYL